jgi:perosamine synthetase
VRVPEGTERDRIVATLNERGVGARVYYARPIHQQPVFASQDRFRDVRLPETERASRAVISLPVHPGLTEAERAYVVQEVNAAC